jgi:hypothetical protein
MGETAQITPETERSVEWQVALIAHQQNAPEAYIFLRQSRNSLNFTEPQVSLP